MNLSRRLATGVLTAVALTCAALTPRALPAHEAECPVCKQEVVQDTELVDNEVAIRYGRKRIEYRCVWCAVRDAKTYTGDLTILAPSELKGKPVLLARKGERWSVQPEETVFLGQKTHPKECHLTFRAFARRAALEAWAKQHGSATAQAGPLTLPQLLELVRQ
ncbi:MAG: hypothetical protein FJX77_11970 [Armatimonadetes bacterium]|nr:hypothetical protein [Armatimonadota bacterium]